MAELQHAREQFARFQADDVDDEEERDGLHLLDADGDKKVEIHEVDSWFSKFRGKVESFFGFHDKNGDGKVSIADGADCAWAKPNEKLRAAEDHEEHEEPSILNHMDSDNDGHVTQEEMKGWLDRLKAGIVKAFVWSPEDVAALEADIERGALQELHKAQVDAVLKDAIYHTNYISSSGPQLDWLRRAQITEA